MAKIPVVDVPSHRGSAADDHQPSGIYDIQRDAVAIVIEDPELRGAVGAIVSSAGHPAAGPEALTSAWTIVAAPRGDVGPAITQLRRSTRTDAAIIVVVNEPGSDPVIEAHRAGAFACLRPPIVAEELLGLVTLAVDSQSAKVQVADLARQLDVNSHLASIGRISAGLSHELGNPLAVVGMSLESFSNHARRLADAEALLNDLVVAPPEHRDRAVERAREYLAKSTGNTDLTDALDDAHSSVEQMTALLATMKELVGRSARSVERIDVVDVVRKVIRRATPEILQGVHVEEVIDDHLTALADPTILAQILINLASNASHAAKLLPSPRIRFHVYTSGDDAVVSVRDNGPGIAPTLQERIFEPFYTTRRGNGGTGLGLALCREYAAQMGARISLWSVPGRGACFRVHMRRPRV